MVYLAYSLLRNDVFEQFLYLGDLKLGLTSVFGIETVKTDIQ